MSIGISEKVTRFIIDHINAVVQLEALLLLRSSPREWTADELSRELRIDHDGAAAQLELLEGADLLVRRDAPPTAYRYQPGTQTLARVVDELAEAYAERRVTIISLIYSKPSASIRVFADAFRILGGNENG